jgi:hypothetical protein
LAELTPDLAKDDVLDWLEAAYRLFTRVEQISAAA